LAVAHSDGISSNSNDGNMPFLDAIFPLEIASIRHRVPATSASSADWYLACAMLRVAYTFQ
jgi:hypothetical protein